MLYIHKRKRDRKTWYVHATLFQKQVLKLLKIIFDWLIDVKRHKFLQHVSFMVKNKIFVSF